MENKKVVPNKQSTQKVSLQEKKVKILTEKLEKESGKKVVFEERKQIDIKKVKALINLLEKYSGKKVKFLKKAEK